MQRKITGSYEQSILQQYELSFKKVLDRDKTGLILSQAFISVEHCSLLITQFNTNIKISVMSHLFQKQDIWVQLLMCNNTKVTCVYFSLLVEINVT